MYPKKSYGVICYRLNKKNQYEIVMIKKSVTYYFCDFVMGKYDIKDNNKIQILLNNMTYNEKMDLLTLNFDLLWYRIYKYYPESQIKHLNNNGHIHSYIKKKKYFHDNFVIDKGRRLINLIKSSKNVEEAWELPKGRSNQGEQPIDTAIREFMEETSIKPNQFEMKWHLKPYVETFKDLDICYRNIYYFAEATCDFEVNARFYECNKYNEVSFIKWMSKDKLIHTELEPISATRLVNMFDKIIKKIKNYRKNHT